MLTHKCSLQLAARLASGCGGSGGSFNWQRATTRHLPPATCWPTNECLLPMANWPSISESSGSRYAFECTRLNSRLGSIDANRQWFIQRGKLIHDAGGVAWPGLARPGQSNYASLSHLANGALLIDFVVWVCDRRRVDAGR